MDFTDASLSFWFCAIIANNQTFGSVKLLTDADGKILAGHIFGANAGELIAPVVYAMRFGLTAETMAEAVRWAASQF